MNDIFPIRLKNARKMRGFSQQGLSDAMQGFVSPNAIKKYEKGEMFPSSEAVIRLASALQVKVDDLFQPFAVKIDMSGIKYRKKSTLRKKDMDSINQIAAQHLEKYIEVERMCGENHNFDKSYANMVVRDENDARSVASKFRQDFNLGSDPISNPIEILESAGAKIIEVNASEKFDGDNFTTDGIFVIILNGNLQSERKRLSIFHETGHKVMSFAEGVDEEKMCNIFANEVLLPSEVFIKMIGRKRADVSLEELKDIQAQYGISVEAMMVKAKQLGIISENRYKTFCIKKSTSQYFKDKVQESIFHEEKSNRFNRLVFKLLASGEITESKCASLLGCPIEDVRKRLMLV